ncbi:MAG: hypothetical protein KGJ60_12980 [Verrucomicrobiota bacterium]|nr:hypothetical protein [Verrucomicrobiota bacterium]
MMTGKLPSQIFRLHNAMTVRQVITVGQLKKFAAALHCEKELQDLLQNQTREPWRSALGNYHAALWRWVWRLTPPEVIDKLNKAILKFPGSPNPKADQCYGAHQYMLWRAIFVYGCKAGERYKARHYRHFAYLAHVADRLNDKEIFEEARQRAWNYVKPKSHMLTRVTRQLKYCLLVSWTVGALWRAQSREAQIRFFKKLWPDSPDYSAETFRMAQKRLGLKWASKCHPD